MMNTATPICSCQVTADHMVEWGIIPAPAHNTGVWEVSHGGAWQINVTARIAAVEASRAAGHVSIVCRHHRTAR